MFEPYKGNGTAKNIKTPVTIDFPPFHKTVDPETPLQMDQ